MEVHHHSHPSPGSGHRKKWTHYFWEFLMLFLAVFCGFLAEYQLEHKIERDRARQYVISFYEDLKRDTAELNRLIEIDRTKLSVLENAGDCYAAVFSNPGSSACLNIIVDNSLSFINFIHTDRTLQQLKNAGGMRMLKRADSDSIYAYDTQLRHYLSYESSLFQERQTNLRNTYSELLHYKNLAVYRNLADSPAVDKNIHLLTTDEIKLNRLLNQLLEYTQGVKVRLSFLRTLFNNAKRKLIYFNSKYNIQ